MTSKKRSRHSGVTLNAQTGGPLLKESPFTALKKAQKRGRRLSKLLRRDGLVGTTRMCTPENPCISLSCNACRQAEVHAFLVKYYPVCFGALQATVDGGPPVEAITIVPTFGRIPRGELHKANLPEFKRKLARLLNYCAPEAWGIFAIDISLNIRPEDRAQDHWQIHVHGIIVNLTARGKRGLQTALKKGAGKTAFPLRTDPVFNLSGWLKYMIKPGFNRRTAVLLQSGPNVRKEPLRLEEEAELASWLAQYKVHQRVQVLRLGKYASKYTYANVITL